MAEIGGLTPHPDEFAPEEIVSNSSILLAAMKSAQDLPERADSKEATLTQSYNQLSARLDNPASLDATAIRQIRRDLNELDKTVASQEFAEKFVDISLAIEEKLIPLEMALPREPTQRKVPAPKPKLAETTPTQMLVTSTAHTKDEALQIAIFQLQEIDTKIAKADKNTLASLKKEYVKLSQEVEKIQKGNAISDTYSIAKATIDGIKDGLSYREAELATAVSPHDFYPPAPIYTKDGYVSAKPIRTEKQTPSLPLWSRLKRSACALLPSFDKASNSQSPPSKKIKSADENALKKFTNYGNTASRAAMRTLLAMYESLERYHSSR